MNRERRLLILFPEEARVGESRGQHLAVAVDHHGGVRRLDIGGAHKGVGEFPARIFAHEIFLVHPRGQLDHLGRHVEEGLVKAAEQRHGPFGQPRVLDHQPFIRDQRQTSLCRNLGRAFADNVLAFLVIDDHMGGAQLVRVIVCSGNADRAGGMEAVADGLAASGDPADFAFHHLTIQQRDNAGERAHPAQGIGADRSRAPAHRLGPAEVADDRGDGGGEHLGHRAARSIHNREPSHAALHVAQFQLLARYAVLLAEAVNRGVRRAFGRALGLFAHRLGRERQSARDQRKAPRSRPDGEFASFDPGSIQLAPEQLFEFSARTRLHPGRDFLAAQFEQEVGHQTRLHPGYLACHSGLIFSA